MVFAASRGKWGEAFLHNPVMFLLLLAGAIVVLLDFLRRPRQTVTKPRFQRGTVAAGLMLALLGNWIYLLLRDRPLLEAP